MKRHRQIDEAADDRHSLVALLTTSLQPRRTHIERRPQQARPEVLLEPAERLPRSIRHVIDGRQVQRLPRLEREHRLGARLIRVESDVLLERHPLLLSHCDDRALRSVGVRLPNLVAIHHHGEALLDEETVAVLQFAHAKVSPDSAIATSEAGGSKCDPYDSANSRARATKPGNPPSYWLMYCSTPPVHAGKPIPKIEPMLASATDVSTPSSTHRTDSRASANSIRSCRSVKGTSAVPELNSSRRPAHRPSRRPDSS